MDSGFACGSRPGDYGKPAEYVEINPNDPSKGFKLKEGTGNLAPPLVATLTLSYKAEGIPQSVVTQNGFLLTDQTVANEQRFQALYRGPRIDAPHLRRHRPFALPRFR